jgi:DNA polymerase
MSIRGRLVVPMYHPAAALHQRSLKPIIEADFKKLTELIQKTAPIIEYQEEEQKRKDEPKQLSMF